jgi:deoxyribodipyrimidine photo-lyase
MKEYTLFIFRRDFRVNDNTGLIHAIKEYKENIIPMFVFTPEQIDKKKNKFRADNGVQFMIKSLEDLDKKLRSYGSKLHLFYGDNIDVIKNIHNAIKENSGGKSCLKAVVFNQDYTPYARERDDAIYELCEKMSECQGKNNNNDEIACDMVEDYLMSDFMGQYRKKDGNPYTVFTPFRNNAIKKFNIRKPEDLSNKKYKKSLIVADNLLKGLLMKNDWKNGLKNDIKYVINKDIQVDGGRKNGLKKLKELKNKNREIKKYGNLRNNLSYQTTELSAYIKFGCVSIREVYWFVLGDLGLKKDDTLISQLYWREFYYYIVFFYPKVLKSAANFNPKYNNLKWVSGEKGMDYLEKWTIGRTGFPVVDAGMTQLNTTGYMHNRSRLITANFLNRMLGLDWRLGERYFAIKLTDYDPAVNNGNWQWVSSTGTDPKPYFQRLFNPIIQSKKFDKDAEYIKKWLPQLKDIPAKHLHEWGKYSGEYDLSKIDYVAPIVDYKEARKRSIEMYRKVL